MPRISNTPNNNRIDLTSITKYINDPTVQKTTAVAAAITAIVTSSLYVAGALGGSVVVSLTVAAPITVIAVLVSAGIIWKIRKSQPKTKEKAQFTPKTPSESDKLPGKKIKGNQRPRTRTKLTEKPTTPDNTSKSEKPTPKPTRLKMPQVDPDRRIKHEVGKKQRRRYPPGGFQDTAGSISISRKHTHFQDDEIIENLSIVKIVPGKKAHSPVDISYTKNGKAIIQQQLLRGEIAAAAAMLIMDKEGSLGCVEGLLCNYFTCDKLWEQIKNAGLTCSISSPKNVEDLPRLIASRGSAIVFMHDSFSRFPMVVDKVSKDSVRLRDPYHGWEITVKADAFSKKWRDGDRVIQIYK